MAEDRADIATDAEVIARRNRITAELSYIRGLIDALRTAPGEVDVTMFLGRIERVVTALEAVMSTTQAWQGPWEQMQERRGPWEQQEKVARDLVTGVALAGRAFGDGITEDIASALLGEAAGSGGPASPPTRDKEEE
jgi:hypothetical protein